MAKKRVLWCIYFQVTWILMHAPQYKGLRYLGSILYILDSALIAFRLDTDMRIPIIQM